MLWQVVSQDELGNMQEVAHVDGEQISIQEIAMDANELGIEVPIEVTTETTEGAESMSMTAGSMLDSGAMESVVIDSNVVETAQDGAITLVTSAMGTHMVDSSSMETGTMAASTMETVETMETVPVSSTDVTVASSEQEAKYVWEGIFGFEFMWFSSVQFNSVHNNVYDALGKVCIMRS